MLSQVKTTVSGYLRGRASRIEYALTLACVIIAFVLLTSAPIVAGPTRASRHVHTSGRAADDPRARLLMLEQ